MDTGELSVLFTNEVTEPTEASSYFQLVRSRLGTESGLTLALVWVRWSGVGEPGEPGEVSPQPDPAPKPGLCPPRLP